MSKTAPEAGMEGGCDVSATKVAQYEGGDGFGYTSFQIRKALHDAWPTIQTDLAPPSSASGRGSRMPHSNLHPCLCTAPC